MSLYAPTHYVLNAGTYTFDYLGKFDLEYTAGQTADSWVYYTAKTNGDFQSFDSGNDTATVHDASMLTYFEGLITGGTFNYGTIKVEIATKSSGPGGDSTSFFLTIDKVSGEFTKPDYGTNPAPGDFGHTTAYADSLNTDTSTITTKWVVTVPGETAPREFLTEADFKDYIKYSGPNKIPEGTYTVQLLVNGKTVNGGDIPQKYIDDGKHTPKGNTTFVVQYPQPTVTIDNTVNPTDIKVVKDISDSTYTWKVYKKGDTGKTPVGGLSGTGSVTDLNTALDMALVKNLDEGGYVVEIIETESSAQGLKGEMTGEFSILNPLTSSTVAPVNPVTGTGTQKMPAAQSDITWKILDGTTLVASGTGLTVPKDEFTKLPVGNYHLEFTETSKYNSKTSIEKSPFEIKGPATSSTVAALNPTTGTGTQALPESGLTWEIKDSTGKLISSGSGKDVPPAEFAKLPNGDYNLVFTETSKYNTHPSHLKDVKDTPFKIFVPLDETPQSSTTVTGTKTPTGTIYNPSSITGGQKLPASHLSWEIKDSTGKVVNSGPGKDVPKTVIDALVDGSYTVHFTEAAVNSKISITDGAFTIVSPDPTPTIDKPIDPESITAVPKLPDSNLSWEIKDPTGKVVVTGNGGSVPPAVINSLPPGDYTAVFTETSLVPGLTAANSVPFTTTKTPVTPVKPGGNTGGGTGGGWSTGGWSRTKDTPSRVDQSPNLKESSSETPAIQPENVLEPATPNTPAPTDKKALSAVNPQTNDTTNQRFILNAFYLIIAVAVVALIVNSLVPKKKNNR